jgi:hypothetical protein
MEEALQSRPRFFALTIFARLLITSGIPHSALRIFIQPPSSAQTRRKKCNRPMSAFVLATGQIRPEPSSEIKDKEISAMKRFLLTIAAMLSMVAGLAANTAGTNFAGTWALDKSKSEGLPQQMANAEITWVITQDDKQIKIEVKRNPEGQMGPAPPVAYNLDGSETMAEITGRMTGKAKRKTKWLDGGKILELNQVSDLEFQGNAIQATQLDHLELAEGGKMLKVHRVSENPRGKQDYKMVFNKQ